MSERCFGVVIEGMFLPNTIKPPALVSAASDRLKSLVNGLGVLFTGVYLNAEEALAEKGGTIDTSVDPFRVRENHGSFTVKAVATDRIGKQLFRKAYRSVGKLDVAITSTAATTIDFNVTGLDGGGGQIQDISGNYNVVYIGTEVILVPLSSETAPGSGIYNSCIRGALMTEAGLHTVGTFVWDQQPYWTGRKVWLFDATENRTPNVKLREVGRISNGFEQDNGNIIIRGSSHLTSLDRKYVNLKPYAIDQSDNRLEYELSDEFLTGAGLAGFFISEDRGLNIRKKFRTTTATLANYDAAFIQINEDFQYYDRRNFINRYRSRNINSLLKSRLLVPGEEQQTLETPHFLFCIINPNYESWIQDGYAGEGRRPPNLPAAAIVGTSYGPTRFFAPTEGFEDLTVNADINEIYKYHPIAICAAFLMSTPKETTNPDEFDLFAPNWSLNVRDAFSTSSIAAIHTLIRENPWDQVQYLVLGKNGEPVKLMDEIRDILQTYGYRLGVDNEGYLTFSKVKLLDVKERSDSYSNFATAVASQLLNFKDGSESTTPRVFGKYGETPFFEGNNVEITTKLDGTYPAIATLDDNELSVKANTIAELGELRTQLEARALVMDFQTPRLKIRVAADIGTNLGLGAWVNLQDLPLGKAWLFDRDGNRLTTLDSSTQVRWVGQVIGRRYLINDNAYEIELFFLNDEVIRWRAPSARVSGFPQLLDTRIAIEVGSLFGDAASDSLRFTVGDEVSIINDDGTWVTTTPLTITAIGAGTTAATSYLEFDSNVALYNIGDYYVELAYLRTSTADGYLNAAVIPNIDRAYTFMGRSPDGKLGTAVIEADQYGG
jgi:hypothetical protein